MKSKNKKNLLIVGSSIFGISLLATGVILYSGATENNSSLINNFNNYSNSNFNNLPRISGSQILQNKIPSLNSNKAVATKYTMKDDLNASDLSVSLGDGSFIYVTSDNRLVREWIDPSKSIIEYSLEEDSKSFVNEIVDLKYDSESNILWFLRFKPDKSVLAYAFDIETKNILNFQVAFNSRNDINSNTYAFFPIFNKPGEFIIAPKDGYQINSKESNNNSWKVISVRYNDQANLIEKYEHTLSINADYDRYSYAPCAAYVDGYYYIFQLLNDSRNFFQMMTYWAQDLFSKDLSLNNRGHCEVTDQAKFSNKSNFQNVKTNYNMSVSLDSQSRKLKLSYVFTGSSPFIFQVNINTKASQNFYEGAKFYDLSNESNNGPSNMDIFRTFVYKERTIFLAKENKFQAQDAPLGVNLYILNGAVEKDFDDNTWALPYNSQWLKYIDKTLIEDQCKINYQNETNYSKIALMPISLDGSTFDSGIFALSQGSKEIWNFELSNNYQGKWKLGTGLILSDNVKTPTAFKSLTLNISDFGLSGTAAENQSKINETLFKQNKANILVGSYEDNIGFNISNVNVAGNTITLSVQFNNGWYDQSETLQTGVSQTYTITIEGFATPVVKQNTAIKTNINASDLKLSGTAQDNLAKITSQLFNDFANKSVFLEGDWDSNISFGVSNQKVVNNNIQLNIKFLNGWYKDNQLQSNASQDFTMTIAGFEKPIPKTPTAFKSLTLNISDFGLSGTAAENQSKINETLFKQNKANILTGSYEDNIGFNISNVNVAGNTITLSAQFNNGWYDQSETLQTGLSQVYSITIEGFATPVVKQNTAIKTNINASDLKLSGTAKDNLTKITSQLFNDFANKNVFLEGDWENNITFGVSNQKVVNNNIQLNIKFLKGWYKDNQLQSSASQDFTMTIASFETPIPKTPTAFKSLTLNISDFGLSGTADENQSKINENLFKQNKANILVGSYEDNIGFNISNVNVAGNIITLSAQFNNGWYDQNETLQTGVSQAYSITIQGFSQPPVPVVKQNTTIKTNINASDLKLSGTAQDNLAKITNSLFNDFANKSVFLEGDWENNITFSVSNQKVDNNNIQLNIKFLNGWYKDNQLQSNASQDFTMTIQGFSQPDGTTQEPQNPTNESKSSKTGVIIGAVIIPIAAVILIVIGVIVLIKYFKSNKEE